MDCSVEMICTFAFGRHNWHACTLNLETQIWVSRFRVHACQLWRPKAKVQIISTEQSIHVVGHYFSFGIVWRFAAFVYVLWAILFVIFLFRAQRCQIAQQLSIYFRLTKQPIQLGFQMDYPKDPFLGAGEKERTQLLERDWKELWFFCLYCHSEWEK